MTTPRILVLGGTGTVGSAVVRKLLDHDADIRVLTRDPQKASLPDGVAAVEGDLLDVGTIERVFRGVDALFLLNALGPTECHEGLMAFNGAREAGVGRIVYLSVHRVDEAPHLPHFGAKLPIETALRESATASTILRANNFFQNDLWLKEVLLGHGVYPQPLGSVGLSRVDVEDIAEVAALALTRDELAGETIDLVGARTWTGEETAEAWGEALGRPIVYAGDDLDAWEEQARQTMPDWMAWDLRRMYAFFQEKGLVADQGAVERLGGILRRPPRSFEGWIRGVVETWNV